MSRESKLVLSSGTYLCSMQGNMCKITTLGGGSPPGKGLIKLKHIQYSHIYKEYNVEMHWRKNHKVLFIWHEEIDAPFSCTLGSRLFSRYSSLTL